MSFLFSCKLEASTVAFDVTITTDERPQPPRLFVYGPEGVGKTTFGATAPNPVFLRAEDGIVKLRDPYTGAPLKPSRMPVLQSFDHAIECLRFLYSNPHQHQTLVIDSADWIERLIHQEIMRSSNAESMAKAAGGYGAGYQTALKKWNVLLAWVNALWSKGMAIIFLAHADPYKFESPEHPAYDRWEPRLHKTSKALLVEWADAVLFATQRIQMKETEDGRQLARASFDERILRCTMQPSAVAKNRFHLPPEIPLQWAAFAHHLAS
jgi:hypothetical protein